MTDIVDQAQIREEADRDYALLGVRRAAALLNRHPTTSRFICGCGDPIEEERRLAVPGAQRCIACELALERTQRLYRSL